MKPVRPTLVFVLSLLSGGCSSQPSRPASASSPRPALQKTYVLPAEFSLKPVAGRGPQGEIYISGSTNFPEGTKMWVDVGPKKTQRDAFVRDGKFRSGPFYQDVPAPITGSQRVEFISYFNGAWQSQSVLSALGDGGKNLHGGLFKLTNPDVADSDKILDAKFTLRLPPATPQAYAICDVKHATLSISGFGPADRDVEHVIAYFMQPQTGVKPGKGWSATSAGGNLYNVTYDFIDGGAGEKQAVWSVDIATKRVKYVNMGAKMFSATPGTVF
ncbi:MAG TPA: hypothetical protein VGY31_05275 [Terriglobia bacterium]|nr:hypothetical protein [Terriglobia bacterium]